MPAMNKISYIKKNAVGSFIFSSSKRRKAVKPTPLAVLYASDYIHNFPQYYMPAILCFGEALNVSIFIYFLGS